MFLKVFGVVVILSQIGKWWLRHLHSTNRQLLAVPRYRLNTYGCRAFSFGGPAVWNSLPDFIWDPTISADCFRRLLNPLCGWQSYVTLQLIWPFNCIRQVAPHSQLAGSDFGSLQPAMCGVQLRRWENQCRLSSLKFTFTFQTRFCRFFRDFIEESGFIAEGSSEAVGASGSYEGYEGDEAIQSWTTLAQDGCHGRCGGGWVPKLVAAWTTTVAPSTADWSANPACKQPSHCLL